MASCVDQDPEKRHDWRPDQVEEGWVRLLNQGEMALHCEGAKGQAELGGDEVEADWWSAMWRMVPVGGVPKGVSLIGHHEMGGNIANYLPQMEEAFAYYQKHGINRIKTGYVSGDIPVYTKRLTKKGREHHHGQFMVNHYQEAVETAAKYEIMIDAHEPIKPTGKSRSYPNFVAREGARGGEPTEAHENIAFYQIARWSDGLHAGFV